MTLYILDTDHLSLFDRNHPFVVERLLSVEENPQNRLSTTVVTFEEQIRGRLAQVRKSAPNSESLVFAYKRLAKTFDLFQDLELIDYSIDADARFRQLRKAGIRIGTQDLRIASIALSNNGVLLTRNRQDFEKVLGLVFQDWSVKRSR